MTVFLRTDFLSKKYYVGNLDVFSKIFSQYSEYRRSKILRFANSMTNFMRSDKGEIQI
jgi:hypothetical protein